jgi:hypothetical protein
LKRALIAGAAIAAIVACGGGSPKKAAVAPGTADAGAAPPVGKHDHRIVEAEEKINTALKQLGVDPLPTIVTPCGDPPCGMRTQSAKPSEDPTCQHGETQTCKDTCTLADSICENAKTICDISKELNDTWANNKCAGAEISCENARKKCCGCV